METMVNFQVRFAEDLNTAGKAEAVARGTSLADVIREAMEYHLTTLALIRAGGKVFHESPDGKLVQVMYPVISRRFV